MTIDYNTKQNFNFVQDLHIACQFKHIHNTVIKIVFYANITLSLSSFNHLSSDFDIIPQIYKNILFSKKIVLN